MLGLGLFLGGAIAASRILGYVGSRFDAWLDSFNPAIYDQQGGSYQLVQGLFGLAAGGLVGTGLGQGRPDIVPLAESDYIIASLGEELGLIGLFAILGLYLLFVSRGFRIGFTGQDDFGRLLGVGLSFVVALQVFVVIGGVTRVIPLTGLTTPFLAAGGSSLVANWIIVALLLRLSDSVRNQPQLVVGTVNKELRRVSIVVLLMFVALFGSSTIIQVFQQDNLKADGRNVAHPVRQLLRRARPDPGRRRADRPVRAGRRRVQVPARVPQRPALLGGHRILHPESGQHRRRGRAQRLPERNGERAVPRPAERDPHRAEPEGRGGRADDRPGVQQAAWDALGNLKGAVVAIDPKTGAILAMVSKPTFDPTGLATHDPMRVQVARTTRCSPTPTTR